MIEQSAEIVEVQDFPGGPLRRSLARQEPRFAAAVAAHEARGRALFAALLEAEGEQRLDLAGTPRFACLALADLLLEASELAQATEPEVCEELAQLAACVAQQVRSPAETPVATEALARARALQGDALRQLGERPEAEAVLELSRMALIGPPEAPERALYCRSLALLRLDQGRIDEGAALLAWAATLYGACGEAQERSYCQAHMGLLWIARGLLRPALPELASACAGLDAERRPALAARALLGLALCHAAYGRHERAAAVVEAARPHAARLAGRREVRILLWMEGRIAAFAGERERAHRLLGAARDELATAGCEDDAQLAALDLALLDLPRHEPWDRHDPVAVRAHIDAALRHAPKELEAQALPRVIAWYYSGIETEPKDDPSGTMEAPELQRKECAA